MEELIKKLQYAQKATQSTLDKGSVMVDFHGLSYWANRVEKLREEIKNELQL